MNERPFDSDFPPDEAWWERELHRNEKLMDKYMAVFDAEGDAAFEKYDTPEKLYNRVHYGIQPGDPLPPEALEQLARRDPDLEAWKEEIMQQSIEAAAAESEKTRPPDNSSKPETDDGSFSGDGSWDELDNTPAENDDYPAIAKQAREFAVRAFELEDCEELDSTFFLSAGKIGANLAGGHGIGYDDNTLCGNIVKCRWALADCNVCTELLEMLAKRKGQKLCLEMLDESRTLSAAIAARIERLRAKVWW